MKRTLKTLGKIGSILLYIYTFICIGLVTIFFGGLIISGGTLTIFGKTYKSQGVAKKIINNK